MRISLTITILAVVSLTFVSTSAQKRPLVPAARTKTTASPRSGEVGGQAIVIDETLSVLRQKPSLFAEPIQRMHRGRKITVLGITEADGVKFYKVGTSPTNFGWVQSDAVFGKFRPGDEVRLAQLVQASNGFDQIEIANAFFSLYPNSKLRTSVLLLFGDLLEEVAEKLSRDANNRLRRGEMAASAAPIHSYFLNFVSLDRYRKQGIVFLFNSSTRAFHYDGAGWREIVKNYPSAAEAAEAQKRLTALDEKMGAKSSK